MKTQTHTLSTEEFAARHHVKAQSVRVRFCERGDYFGHVPVKLPNGRLSWPDPDEQEATEASNTDAAA